MTAIVLSRKYDADRFFQPTEGVSDAAICISDIYKRLFAQFNDSVTRTARPISVINQLLKLERECSTNEWDGYDAITIDSQTLDNVYKFIGLLDDDLPSPELCPEPDGEVAAEWYGDNDATISISIGQGNIVSFAAIFSNQLEVNGTEYLEDEDKGNIERYIKKVIES